ncbi:MAG: thiosulfate oxidation carrier protein SoxY [Methylococcaceae bacterium]|nr:thiosulfate oxidation carrier protein SoxY [Methylococcaceae bacterium]
MKDIISVNLNNRRNFLKKTTVASAYAATIMTGLLASENAQAEWLADLFAPAPMEDSFNHSFNTNAIALSDEIKLKLPTIAENGAVVPITVTSTLENVEQVYIFVEKNPVPLVAIFDLSPELDAFVSARVKMAKTSDVIAVVKTQSKLYKAQKLVKVTIGGCGG